jgi:hypothetical protein
MSIVWFLIYSKTLPRLCHSLTPRGHLRKLSRKVILVAMSFRAGRFDEHWRLSDALIRVKDLPVLIPLFGKLKMRNNSEHSFAIIRFNEKTYISGGVMAVVKGTESAQKTLNDYEWCQSQEDRSSGWRYFMEETDLQPGTDPSKATKLRQLRLDLQESQASISS